MSHPDALDLYNECLSIVEQTTDDRTAERVLLIAFRLLQMADEDFARHCSSELKPAANNIDWPSHDVPATTAFHEARPGGTGDGPGAILDVPTDLRSSRSRLPAMGERGQRVPESLAGVLVLARAQPPQADRGGRRRAPFGQRGKWSG
jgi:hypothetical protein